jgi:hypothetical protein
VSRRSAHTGASAPNTLNIKKGALIGVALIAIGMVDPAPEPRAAPT